MKNYLYSMKNSYKNKAYFLLVILKKKKKNGKQSHPHATHNSYKYYLLLD